MDIPLHRRGVREVVKKVVDEQFGRNKWEIEHQIYDKADEEEEEIIRYKTLKAREGRFEEIDKMVGSRKVVVKEGPKKDQQGFHCKVCDENFLSSDAYFDHNNSERHNRKLGMNMNVDKVSASTIKEKLMSAKQMSSKAEVPQQRFVMEEIRQKLEEQQRKKNEKKQQKQAKLNQIVDGIDQVIKQNNSNLNHKEEEDDLEQEMKLLGLPVGSKRVKK